MCRCQVGVSFICNLSIYPPPPIPLKQIIAIMVFISYLFDGGRETERWDTDSLQTSDALRKPDMQEKLKENNEAWAHDAMR